MRNTIPRMTAKKERRKYLPAATRMNTANNVMIGECGENCKTPPSSPLPNRENLLTMDQKHSSQDIFISISGLIGAGKTTLATTLAEKMDLPCFYEPVIDNEYLGDFYRDPARYSFPLQVCYTLKQN